MDKIPQPEANVLAAAPPGSVTVGGVLYLLRQPTLQLQTAIATFARNEFLKDRETKRAAAFREFAEQAALVGGLPQDIRAELLGELKAGLAKLTKEPEAQDLTSAMFWPRPAAFMVWILAKDATPGLTFETILADVNEVNAYSLASECLTALGLAKVDPNEVGAIG